MGRSIRLEVFLGFGFLDLVEIEVKFIMVIEVYEFFFFVLKK